MRLLKVFKNGIDNVTAMGKSLGDAFVWHFYQLDLPELVRNLDYPEIRFFPTGTGGIGELKFIKTHFIFNDHFIILHGISNFLRIGDISFFSLKDGRLSAIGEIKTKGVGENKINVSVTALNVFGRNIIDENLFKEIEIDETIDFKEYFDPGRFKRQINRTNDFLRLKEKRGNEIDKLIYDRYFVREFEDVVEGLKKKDFSLKRVDSDILFAANRLSCKKFSKRIFIKQDAVRLKKFEPEIEKAIISILNTDKPNYQIQFGSVHFDSHFKTRILIGCAPLFWYPIKPIILKQIYFLEIYVLTLFNPTNFLADLSEIGIELIKDEVTNKPFFGKKGKKGIIKIEYFNYFFSLIENSLHTPKAVVSMIKEMVLLAESKEDVYKGSKIMTQIFHLFTHYNKDDIS
jgi:hypothetical protein